MFMDAYKWVKKCEKCKLFGRRPKLAVLPLRPVVIKEPFKKWGLHFIEPLNLVLSVGYIHILTTIDYFTKWVEAEPIKKTTSEVVSKFLMENILVRFGIPEKIINDNAQNFSSKEIIFLLEQWNLPIPFL